MLERAAVVESVGDGVVRLRLGAACDGCGACGGRCGLFGVVRADGDVIDLPSAWCDGEPCIGEPVRIYHENGALIRQARSGYGLPLSGLLGGALLGHLIAEAFGIDADPTAVLGAALGTLSGLAVSKRASPLPCRFGPATAVHD